MKELRSIVDRFDEIAAAGGRAALATVIGVDGSSYRSPGARMLVDEEGATFGTVSGGCLEADLRERARRVLDSGAAEVVVYDTRATGDSVFGLGLGCRGVVEILLEPAGAGLVELLRRRLAARAAGAAATVVAVRGAARQGVRVGARVMVDDRGVAGDALDHDVRAALAAECLAALEDERSRRRSFDFGEAFVEYLAPRTPLVVFGAGRDAVPLVRLARELGWHVTVVDHREALVAGRSFAGADEVVVARAEEAAARVAIDQRTAVVLMTHNYAHDLALLGALLPSPARYLGVLGPKHRTDRLLEDLARGGAAPPAADLERLYAPAGLDLGAEAPEEIALSILAEVRAVTAGRGAGMLRDRAGAIHGDARGTRARAIGSPAAGP